MFEQDVETAEEELKRADHLIYVSLKYTRTCDVMKNAIKRLIAAFELSMERYLEFMRKNKSINEVPNSVKEKSLLVKKLLGNSIRKYMTLYNLLKRIDKADYIATEEFRKNVTLTTKEANPVNVKVENLCEYLDITKDFVSFMTKKSE